MNNNKNYYEECALDGCKEVFQQTRKHKNQKFCSKTCFGKVKGDKTLWTNGLSLEKIKVTDSGKGTRKVYSLICQKCTNEFNVYSLSRAKKVKFCGQKCKPGRPKAIWVDETCRHCSLIFKVRSTQPNHKYCSKACSNLARVGTTRTKEDKIKISNTMKGMVANNKGLKPTKEARLNMRNGQLKRVAEGRHNNYKGGITKANTKIRNSLDYRLWREAVFKKDDYTCQICEKRGGKLQVDHIKSFANYPELRLEVTNGRVLCISCHKQTPNYGFKVLQDKTL